ncbi:MAG: Integral rane sensor signal transduction histidine kinase [Pedosphaera sp.]|nr:Integral rane sensor signal transduction histidine kinase [Pedosphaera sp.]
MTIRTRLTLWYAVILFVSIAVILALSYHELVGEKAAEHPESKSAAGEHEEQDEGFGDIVKIVVWWGIPAAVLGLGGGWWLMRKALTPVAALTEAAARIHEGNLHEQLPRTGNGDELDRLTEVFNAMTGRLNNSFNRIREFTLHASHELKTPLTVMHGELETALREEAPNNRERLLSQLDEVQRLSKIVDGLSLLTKADAGLITLRPEPVRLDELVRDNYADAQILAQPSDVQVKLEQCDEISLHGDRHRLRQLLLNLTDNAIKYNHAKGNVSIALQRVNGSAELSIVNTGPGIPAELQTRVFDRFFRGDASHNNAVDGCGLGLSIAQWIVTAHKGTIHITSQPEKLTTIRVCLPIASA